MQTGSHHTDRLGEEMWEDVGTSVSGNTQGNLDDRVTKAVLRKTKVTIPHHEEERVGEGDRSGRGRNGGSPGWGDGGEEVGLPPNFALLLHFFCRRNV